MESRSMSPTARPRMKTRIWIMMIKLDECRQLESHGCYFLLHFFYTTQYFVGMQ